MEQRTITQTKVYNLFIEDKFIVWSTERDRIAKYYQDIALPGYHEICSEWVEINDLRKRDKSKRI